MVTGTGNDQNVQVTGYTGGADTISTNATLTTTWQRFTTTATVPAATTEIAVNFNWTTTGTASTNDYFDVTGVQLEVGNQVSPYAPATPTFATEVAACQRYYYRATVNLANQAFGMAQAYSTTNAYGVIPFPVTMRSQPTALEQTGTAGDYRITTINFGAVNCTSVPAYNTATTFQGTVIFAAAAGLVAGNASSLQSTASTAYLGWSAEL
jgi:hypothetical protein